MQGSTQSAAPNEMASVQAANLVLVAEQHAAA